MPQWEKLVEEAIEPNPFYEPWVLLPSLHAYPHQDLRTVVVWQDGRLAGLFPFQAGRSFRGLPVPSFRSWRHPDMLICTPLVHAKYVDRCLAGLLKSGIAPLIEFDWIYAGGAFYGALAEAADECGLPWMVTDLYLRATLERGRDPRTRFNSNMKNNLRRWQTRLAAAGELTPVRLAPGDDIARWTEEFLRLEASGWKGEGGTALACREERRRFATELFAEAFRRGRLLITGLDLAGKPLTRHVVLVGGEAGFTYKIAYDEAYASHSPGIVGEVDNVGQFLDNPGPRWVDSNTARTNTSYGRVWKDRRAVQRVAVGLRRSGRICLAALPFARLAKRALSRPAQNQAGE